MEPVPVPERKRKPFPPAVQKHVERTAALRAAGKIPAGGGVGGRKAASRAKPLPCIHLGQPTGATRPCRGCGGRPVAVPLVACAVFGVCTLGKAVTLEDGTPVKPCNSLCPGHQAAPPASGTGKPGT